MNAYLFRKKDSKRSRLCSYHLISPKKRFLQDNEEYTSISPIMHLTNNYAILKKYEDIALNNSDYKEAKTYLLFLEQLNTILLHQNQKVRKTPRICFTILAHDKRGNP